MSWKVPKLDVHGNPTPSGHIIPVGWWEPQEQYLPEPHDSKQLEEYFNKYHRCERCNKVIRSHQSAAQPCKEKL